MPAAPQRERRGSSRSRTKASADRARPRAQRDSAPAPSKLRAARGAGVTPGMAAGAAGLLAVMILVAALATGGRGQWLVGAGEQAFRGAGDAVQGVRAFWRGGLAIPGPRLGQVRLRGASSASRDEILAAAAVRPGVPLMEVDLQAVRARVERVGWVSQARVMRLLPDTVAIAVTERPLLAVWQIGGVRQVVTDDGRPVSGVTPEQFRGLPLIIGAGANTDAAAILPLIRARPSLASRLWALRRVDGRRWDILLKDHGVVLLPAAGEAAALDRLQRLDRVAGILSLGLARIDLRDSRQTIVRPAAAGPVSNGV